MLHLCVCPDGCLVEQRKFRDIDYTIPFLKPVLSLRQNMPDTLWREMVESIFLKVDWWYWADEMAAPRGGVCEAKNTEEKGMFVHAYRSVKLHW